MRTTRLKLGEMLREAGTITNEQIEKALLEQKRRKRPIGDILVELGYVSEQDIAETLAIQLDIPFVSGDSGGLSYNNSFTPYPNKRICRSQIYTNVMRKDAKNSIYV